MNEIPRVAVVATHNRPVELARLLDAIRPQCDFTIVVDNASEPAAHLPYPGSINPTTVMASVAVNLYFIRDEEQPPNLSRLWNVGLNQAAALMHWFCVEAYDVAVLNDDAVPPPGWWDAVSGAMRDWNAAAASACPFDTLPPGSTCLYGPDAPFSVTTRLAGWAFMLRGELGMRADERLRWWCGDDDLSARARALGGVVHVGGVPVPNTGANSSTTGVLAEQAGRDMQTFVEIHGRRPW